MAFCRKCGAAMAEDDLVCVKCGTKVANGKNDLIDKLEKYKQLLGENEELETMIRPQSEFPSSDQSTVYKKRSFIRFFWPFLAGGIGGAYLIYMISTLIVMASVDPYSNNVSASSLMGDTLIGYVLAFIVGAAVIFMGVKIAKSKQAAINSNAEYMMREQSERYQKGLLNEKMVNLYQENINNMRQYERIVPEPYRSSSKVGSILNILKDDKAQTVEEAIMMLG